MKKTIIAVIFGLVSAITLAAQSGHSVALSATAGSDDTGFNIYRLSGICPTGTISLTPFTKLNTTPLTTPVYNDTSVTFGAWCYTMTGTAVAGGVTYESVPSNVVNPSVLPFPVVGLTATPK